MSKTMDILIENRLFHAGRDILVYHHVPGGSYLLSPGNWADLSFRETTAADYLDLSMVCGHGSTDACWLSMPALLDLDLSFSYNGHLELKRDGGIHRRRLTIPAGTGPWSVTIALPEPKLLTEIDKQHINNARVIVGDG